MSAPALPVSTVLPERLPEGSEWTFELLERFDAQIRRVALLVQPLGK